MAYIHTYNPVTGDYVATTDDYGYAPANAVDKPLPPRPWAQKWPRWNGKKWEMVDDHRERKAPVFDAENEQQATDYWLPSDTHETPARHMVTTGPLPKGALLERPAKPAAEALAEAKEGKAKEIVDGYQKAVAATLTMPQAEPTAQDVAVGAALFAADDAEGLAYVVAQLAAKRSELLAAVDGCETSDAVNTIEARYAV